MTVSAALPCKPHDNDVTRNVCCLLVTRRFTAMSACIDAGKEKRLRCICSCGPRPLEQVTHVVRLSDPEGMGKNNTKLCLKSWNQDTCSNPCPLDTAAFGEHASALPKQEP